MTADVEPPVVIDDPAAAAWFDEADLVVAGFGGAGVVTALEAVEHGARVLAVDRFAGGGATAISGGVVYAGGTRHQRAAGVQDSPEDMFRYLAGEGVPVGEDTLRRFCEHSSDDLDWLAGHGVRFGSSLYRERVTLPPDGYHLYFTGMEKVRDWARPAPRGHRTVGRGHTGDVYYDALRRSALRRGVRLIEHAPVRRLAVDPDGRVIGVEAQILPTSTHAEHSALFHKVDPFKPLNGLRAERVIERCRRLERSARGERRLLRAHRGVVLCCGGYTYNLALCGRHRPLIESAHAVLVRAGTMGCDGSGIELGMTAGAGVDGMERLMLTKSISPPEAFLRGILVDVSGRRIIAEDAYFATVGEAVAALPGEGAAWLLLDAATFRAGLREMVSGVIDVWPAMALVNVCLGGTRTARSLSRLGSRLGVPSYALRDTITRYNEGAGRRADELGKQAEHLAPMRDGRCFAVNMALRNRWGFSGAMSLGGLTVDEDSGAVIRPGGSVIDGLYAAGRTAVGLPSGFYVSGLSLADTVFSGRRAARAAVGAPVSSR